MKPDATHTHGARDSHGTETPTHPLDRLTPDEITRVRDLLDQAGHLQEDTRFAQQIQVEPPKAKMLEWKAGEPLMRRVVSTLLDRDTGRVREAVVDLDSDEVVSVDTLPTDQAPYGQPQYLFEEYEDVDQIVKADERWRDAMSKRGFDEAAMERALVVPLAPGQFGEPDEVGKRMMRSLTFCPPEGRRNPWSYPVEGLVVLLNVTERKIVKFWDEGIKPLPDVDGDYDHEASGERRTTLKPLEITQPEGPSFAVEGSHVRWENWDFRVGFSMREGLVLNQLTWRDDDNGGEVRPVLHRASVPEMVVPYGDTSECRRWISYFDAGEYHLGKNANSLEIGCDCLGVIHYFDGHVAADTGEPMSIPRVICMHEEDYGVLWKHRELDGETQHSRRSRRLVISYFATVGNYDYGFFWYLYLDGTIQLETKATGLVFAGANEPGLDLPHATEMAPGLYAPVHQHIFCARLDFDLDGTDNFVEEVDIKRMPMGEGNVWGNAFTWTENRITEAGGYLGDNTVGRSWKIGSNQRKNAVGKPTKYHLIPEARTTLLNADESTVAARASFATKHLWVTEYKDGELFPAGMYPNQHTGGGLPEFVKDSGPVDSGDIVVWHSFGLTHLPRPEDWPIMPVDYSSMWLKPSGFLDRNPTLNLPGGSSDAPSCCDTNVSRTDGKPSEGGADGSCQCGCSTSESGA